MLSENNITPSATDDGGQNAEQDKRRPEPNTPIAAPAAPITNCECCKSKETKTNWTEIFAFIAAIGGILAAIFSWYQGWVSRDTEKRQTRAYVHISKVSLSITPENFVTVSLVYKNYGNTPANKVQDYACLAIRARKKTKDGVDTTPKDLAPTFLKKNEIPHGIIAPNETVNKLAAAWCDKHSIKSSNVTVPLSTNERAGLRDGSMNLYLYGEIFYLDAFDCQRFTRFRYFTNDGIMSGGDRVLDDVEGNCSDEYCPDNGN